MPRSLPSHPPDPNAALLRAYSASARVNQYLVERLHPAVWRAKALAPQVRTVAAIVAHLHNCGLTYLRRAAPGARVPGELDRFRVTPTQAARALGAKRRAVLRVAAAALAGSGRIDGFRHDAATFLTYYMVHDGHHRGQILLLARLCGHPVSQKVMSDMWQWDARARE